MNIMLYEVSPQYINYLQPYAPHLFHNKKPGQHNNRKYIGIVLEVNGFKYFAPMSSYKPKHDKMSESLDFIKLGKYSVINLNNMFPIPDGLYTYIDISKERDPRYKSLLLAEYRIIRVRQNLIRKNAAALYKHKLEKGESTSLSKRCNNFSLLEEVCLKYQQ